MIEKYRAELGWWLRETAEAIIPWYLRDKPLLWGYELPETPVNRYADNWRNALATAAAVHTPYAKHLGLMPDRDLGVVLDVGSGPLLPMRHLRFRFGVCLDPMMEHYAAAGFPVDDAGMLLASNYGECMWRLPSNAFDSVISYNAMDHVDDFERVIAEIERVCVSYPLVRLGISYHTATKTEPHELSDERVTAAFKRFTPIKLKATKSQEGIMETLWTVRC